MAMVEAGEVADGPVMSMMSKRLRALRKRYNRILQMEEGLAQGKSLNKEQEEVLRSKPAVATLIEEYEKLRQPLSAALQEELSLARPSPSHSHSHSPSAATEGELEDQGDAAGTGSLPEPQGDPYEAVNDVLNLLYFGCLFDVKPQSEFASMVFTRTHERQCCLTYDYVTDDSTGFLREDDLDLISSLGSLIIARPVHSGVSHEDALFGCLQHARLWLCNSDQPIRPGSSTTYAGLRERLNRIMTSDYFTRTPELKAPVDVVAAMGKYATCQVQVPDSSEPPSSALAEAPPSDYQDKDDDVENFERNDTMSNPDNDSQKTDETDVSNTSGDAQAVQHEQQRPIGHEPRQKDADLKELQYVPRRAYQNQRGGNQGRGGSGGGRRGYVNGRGGRGGGYQNGRSQYYDSGYYPRNYYTMTGRGSRDGGSAMHNHVGAINGGHVPSNVELGA
uniref:Glycine-rich protein n=1 Tax=Anthurium amnicola TaxID=1678845 RepID=A0A1D1XK69_9ARAE